MTHAVMQHSPLSCLDPCHPCKVAPLPFCFWGGQGTEGWGNLARDTQIVGGSAELMSGFPDF